METRSITLTVGFTNTTFVAPGRFGWFDRGASLIRANLFCVCVMVVYEAFFVSRKQFVITWVIGRILRARVRIGMLRLVVVEHERERTNMIRREQSFQGRLF